MTVTVFALTGRELSGRQNEAICPAVAELKNESNLPAYWQILRQDASPAAQEERRRVLHHVLFCTECSMAFMETGAFRPKGGRG